MYATLRKALASALLGPPGADRALMSKSVMVVLVTMAFALVQHAQVLVGLIDRQQSNLLTAVNLGGVLVFYALLRSGFSRRYLADRSLTLPQMVWGLLATAWSYAITGPARGAVLTVMVLILVFGMFSLSVGQSRRLTLLALGSLVVVMAWKAQSEPERYPPVVEAVHLLFALLVLWGVYRVSIGMGMLRTHLQAQKQSLKDQKVALQQALEQIQRLATQDDLTGLYNRRHMRSLLIAPGNTGVPATLVLMDIDNFKNINDRHGHGAGDAVLKRFAETGRSVLRGDDVLARWGGEEFLLLQRDTVPADTGQCVDRLREVLAGTSFDDVAPGLRLTFSAGLSVYTDSQSLDDAIEAADQAMYRAKQRGRNCTVVAEPAQPEVTEPG